MATLPPSAPSGGIGTVGRLVGQPILAAPKRQMPAPPGVGGTQPPAGPIGALPPVQQLTPPPAPTGGAGAAGQATALNTIPTPNPRPQPLPGTGSGNVTEQQLIAQRKATAPSNKTHYADDVHQAARKARAQAEAAGPKWDPQAWARSYMGGGGAAAGGRSAVPPPPGGAAGAPVPPAVPAPPGLMPPQAPNPFWA
jgi:hypothetical protein